MTSKQIADRIFSKIINLQGSSISLEFYQKSCSGSFFRRASRARLSKSEMQASAAADPIKGLYSFWKETNPELLPLIDDLNELAKSRKKDLEETRPSDRSDISQFIYQMW